MRLQTVDLQDAPESPASPVTGAEEPSLLSNVTTKLDGLTSAVADIAAHLESDGKQSRGSAPAWIAAVVMLLLSLVIVFAGIHRGGETPTEAAAASRFQAQATSISSHLQRALNSEAQNCPGPAGSAATLKCEFQDANISPSTYATLARDEHWALLDLSSADRLELEGPTVLAFGSALTGAVLGWMLAQGLGWRRRSRAERESPGQWPGTLAAG